MNRVTSVVGREILDSRGNPTLEVTLGLGGGATAVAAVPSGASTGKLEAMELRDRDRRYHGKGVIKCVGFIEDPISPALRSADLPDQKSLDSLLLELDGTPNKSKLGANTLLAVSLAFARASAIQNRLSLVDYLRASAGGPRPPNRHPLPMMNVINGGVHSAAGLSIQEFMIVPIGAPDPAIAIRMGAEVFQTLRILLKQRGMVVDVGDEGGFAPHLPNTPSALSFLVSAIEQTGYKPGIDVAVALDCAATQFHSDKGYWIDGKGYHSGALSTLYDGWFSKFPLISIEDGNAEDDWDGWIETTRRLGGRVTLVGDDLLVTRTDLLKRAIELRAANAILIKPNQVGTLTETLDCIRAAHAAGWKTIISHRSGETTDTFIVDLAVAVGAWGLKAGAPCRGERTAKYNRLMEIANSA